MQTNFVRAANQPVQVQGFIYVHRVGVDTVSDILGTNVSRISNGKAPYRVILDDAAQVVEVRQGAVRFAGEYAELISSADRSALPRMRAKRHEAGLRDMLQSLRLAMQRFDDVLIDNEATGTIERLDPASTKLYVAGHGENGGDGLLTRTTDGRLLRTSSGALADHLRTQVRLDASYKDLRLLACHGAPPPADVGRSSTLATMAQAMGNAGFGEMIVSAYPGVGLKFPKVFDGHLHNAVLLDGKSRPVRRSGVRQRLATTGQLPAAHQPANTNPATTRRPSPASTL